MDNYDLVGDIPGYDAPGKRSNKPGFEEVNDNGSLLARVRKFYDEGVGAFEENRRMHSEDLNFIYNSEAMGQWDPVVLQNRRGKPCYTFNRVIGPVNLVVSDMRQTKPAGKVRPASDGADEIVADIYGGLCRSIEQASRAEQIYKEQYKYAVAGGFGAWRIMPVWMSDDGDGAFDQVLRVVDIPNPQTVVWDPECNDPCAGDANQAIVAERINENIYSSLYGDSDEKGVSFNFSRDSYGWFTDKEVRIAEYFERVPYEKWIARMTDGSVKDYDADLKRLEAHFDEQGITYEKHGVTRVAQDNDGNPKIRKTITWKVLWVKCDGSNVLEGPYVYNWKRIPIVRCPGRYVNIEGRKKLQSLVRHAKDAQRSYNSRCSDMIERSALVPKAPYLVTSTMIKGFENEWNQANVQSRPYLPYNVDTTAPEGGMPYRTPPIDLPQGAMALAQLAQQDIQATTGFFDPALGNADDMNRVSGKALVTHTKRSDLGSYEFVDGFGAALQLTWEMFIDMIPTVYDNERAERIIGTDGTEKIVQLNQEDPMGGDIIHDLKKGHYDVTVTIGPSFQTARQETLATLIDASTSIPSVAQLCPDLLVKNIDSPDAIEMARRLRVPLIQQGIVQPTDAEKQAGIGQKTPQQQQAEQMQQMQTQLLGAKVGKATADAQIASGKASASHLEGERLAYETAGKHLQNMKMARDLGNDQLAAQAEANAAQADQQQQQAQGQQQLQQQQAAGQQDLQQSMQQHAADLQRQREKHQLDMQHAGEKHTQALSHAKELAAIKKSQSKKSPARA